MLVVQLQETMSNKSKAAAGLCSWAINIVRYYDVWSTVEPKRQELAQGAVCGVPSLSWGL